MNENEVKGEAKQEEGNELTNMKRRRKNTVDSAFGVEDSYVSIPKNYCP